VNSMIAPYANVIRMHVLIFVFAGLHIMNLGGLAVYPVLAAYFFPWKKVLHRRSAFTAAASPPDQK
jgi:hypothetical protein